MAERGMTDKQPIRLPRHQVPWHLVRDKCARCGGHHAPWWGRSVPAPSCREGSDRENSMVMFLEISKALGH